MIVNEHYARRFMLRRMVRYRHADPLGNMKART
jgi:hypothetical protein